MHIISALLKLLPTKPGSERWLVNKEIQYGGIQLNVPRRTVSLVDPRSQDEIATGGMTGGDRMQHHGYAVYYARYLKRFLATKAKKQNDRLVVCEIGILRGSGLAVWCDLFPFGRVLGFDIDLSHIQENLAFLEERGAFTHAKPELHQFDQLKPNAQLLASLFCSDSINVCVDDGLHTDDAILKTFGCFKPYLSDEFVYFVEDSLTAADLLRAHYPQYQINQFGELTVVTRK